MLSKCLSSSCHLMIILILVLGTFYLSHIRSSISDIFFGNLSAMVTLLCFILFCNQVMLHSASNYVS